MLRWEPAPDEIAARIASVAALPSRIGIDGIDCAGKTTLADHLASLVEESGRPPIRAGIDGFLRPKAERYRRGALSPEGYYRDSFDFAAVRRGLLDPLAPGGDRRYVTAICDGWAEEPVAPVRGIAPDDAVLLFDGVFLQRPELRDAWDLMIWVDVPFDEALRRAGRRDRGRFGPGVAERYLTRYQPGQRLYLAECRPAERADLVVRSG